MGALLPTLQAHHIREGLTDYLATTFALTDPEAQAALTDFVGDPENGMFKGPYVRLRLPFAAADGDWSEHLDWSPADFTPYGHQARAFERLSDKLQDRPKPTMAPDSAAAPKVGDAADTSAAPAAAPNPKQAAKAPAPSAARPGFTLN